MRSWIFAGLLLLASCGGSPNRDVSSENVSADASNLENMSMSADVNAAIDMNTSAADLNAADIDASTANAVADMNSVDMSGDTQRLENLAMSAGPGDDASVSASSNADSVPVSSNGTAPSGTSKVDCDILGVRVAFDACEDARALARDVKPGAAALDVPDPMTRGRASQVTLVIDRRSLEKIAAAENGQDGEAQTPNQVAGQLPGKDVAFRSEIGRFMKASLAGQGFDIKLLSPDSPLQEIAIGGQGMWIWEVTPREAGSHVLTARTEAVAMIDGRAVPLGNGMTSKNVGVEVRRMDAIRDFLTDLPGWLKLITAILVAAGAFVGAWYGLRKTVRGERP